MIDTIYYSFFAYFVQLCIPDITEKAAPTMQYIRCIKNLWTIFSAYFYLKFVLISKIRGQSNPVPKNTSKNIVFYLKFSIIYCDLFFTVWIYSEFIK